MVGDTELTLADFSHLPTRCRFVAFMPQWDFLDFLALHAKAYPGFELRMQAEATDLITEAGRVVGVRARTPEGELEIRADLVVGADGRHSLVREKAGLAVEDIGAPMDALWMRLPRRPDDPEQPVGRFGAGEIYVMLNRGDYYQCALVIPKGGFEALRERGLEALRARIAALAPFVADRVGALQSWDDLKLLTVAVDRLTEWSRPGPAVHRRRGARDVAGRRRRHQPRGPGRGRGGEHPLPAAARAVGDARRPGCGAAPARAADARHPAPAGRGPEPHHRPDARQSDEADAALDAAAFRPPALPAPDSSPPDRLRVSTGAYPDARGREGRAYPGSLIFSRKGCAGKTPRMWSSFEK